MLAGLTAQAQPQDLRAGKDRMMPKAGAMKDMPGHGDINQLIGSWPEDSKKAAMAMTQKYGPPQEAHTTGPYARPGSRRTSAPTS